MMLSGHKTGSVFDRYNIVSEADLEEAAAKIERGRNERKRAMAGVRKPQLTPKLAPRQEAIFDGDQCRSLVSFYHTVRTNARVAKLADARDLKSRVLKGTYRFDSDPGHQLAPDPSVAFGISLGSCPPRAIARREFVEWRR